MPNTKIKIFSDDNGPASLYRFSSLEDLCSEYDGTPWCSNSEALAYFEDILTRFPKPLYVFQDVIDGKLQEWLIYQSPSGTNIFDSNGDVISQKVFVLNTERGRKIDKVLNSLLFTGSDFKEVLKNFIYGRATASQLETFPKVSEIFVRQSDGTYGSSKIHLKIPFDKLKEKLGLTDADAWEMGRCLGRVYYGENTYFYSDNYDYLTEINPLDYVNSDNEKRFYDILKIIFPTKKIRIDMPKTDMRILLEEFKSYLENNKWENLVEPIFIEIENAKNEQIAEALCISIKNTWRNFLNYYGASYYDFGDEEMVFDAGALYVQLMMTRNKFLSSEEFIQSIGEDYPDNFPEWEDAYYFENEDDMDTHSINYEFEKFLNNLEEKIQDIDWEENEKIVKYLENMGFYYGKSKELPTDKRYSIVFNGMDPKTSKINLKVQKGLKQSEFVISFENFVNLIENRKLFSFESLFGF